ncbi:fimbrial major subunit CsuA/B family protein [Duganella sp. FT50W]|uniref:Fimbrial major subunit CsuA/B family protein n=1 Tax=Duganella lactea TaxID=2692173 RepID=A0A6L8MRV1_9BURK|nr:spore coat U domain-containing protein [Duganella lactea]MYM84755.1 fimbrial major subunit CsuA/B family protein [Duganella lactea]
MRSKTITRAALVAAFGAAMVPMLSGAITTKTQTFDVTLKIIADCIIATSTLDFGQSQGVLATAVNQTSQLQVTCTNTTPYNIGLNAGTGTGSTIGARVMSGTGANTSTVAYNLYQTAGATNWGNTPGSDTKSGTGTGSLQTLTVYGTIPAQSTPQPDTYKSTITATVYF